ncbi:MAG: hypothetical protein KDK70_24130 [Myxococcales bacterium]|nr:hypothetical protein [Myxococcales bacterium]
MVHARITGTSPHYTVSTVSTIFDTPIAIVENATGGPLTVGLAGLDSDGKQVTVEIKATTTNGPKILVALDDSVESVQVFVDAHFSASGWVHGTAVGGPFTVTQDYRMFTATVTSEGITATLARLYLSTSGTVEITNDTASDDDLDVLADGDLLTTSPIAPNAQARLTPPTGTSALTLQAHGDSSLQQVVPLYDTTQATATIDGASSSDAQPPVVTPGSDDLGTVTMVNAQTSTSVEASWAGGASVTIAAQGQGEFYTSGSSNVPVSTWYLDWSDAGDADPKVVVKRLATTNGRRPPT